MNEEFYREANFRETPIGRIPKEWKAVKLRNTVEGDSDIVAGPFGSNLKVCDYRPEGVPIIRLQNIERNQFIDKDIKHISPEKAEELCYHSYKSGDIVLAKLGDPIGKTCTVPLSMKAGVVVADVVRIRPSPKKAITLFVEYVLNSSICFNQLRRETIGSTRPRVNISQVRNLKIPLPQLDEQQKIASVLSTIDEVIQKTDEIIVKTQEFKKGLMQRLLTKGIGHTRFKKTEIGEIPEKWEVVRLGERKIAKIIMGQSPPSSTYNEDSLGLPFLQGKMEFGAIYPNPRMYCSKPIKIASKDDVLISVRAPVGEVNISPLRCCIGRGLAAIRASPTELDSKFAFYYLKHVTRRLLILGCGSTFKAIRKGDLNGFLIPLPRLLEQQEIAKILWSVDEKIERERQTKENLEKTKRWFMQNLLTGKIRIKVD